MLLEMRQLRGIEVAERGAFGQAARIPAAENNAVRDFTSRDLRHVLDLAGGALRLPAVRFASMTLPRSGVTGISTRSELPQANIAVWFENPAQSIRQISCFSDCS
jgi:hypothetical protein